MKQHFDRIFSALLALMLCVGLMIPAIPAYAAEASGTCGENITWTLENGTLTVTGSGAMADFSEKEKAPWAEYADQIQCVKVGGGISKIGELAFYHCKNLTTVSLAASVQTLGQLAFAGCFNLTQVSMPGVQTIGYGCFYDCTALRVVTLPQSLRIIEDKAFYHCSSLAGITIPESVEALGSSAFCYCENLVYVKIKCKITVLPYWTFYGCDRLSELYLPGSVEEVEESALSECPNLHYVSYSGSQEVKEEINKQLSEETTKKPSDTSDTLIRYESTDHASVTTQKEIGGDTTVDATVTDPAGWEEVADYIKESNFHDEPQITIEAESGVTIPAEALNGLASEQVIITIHTSDNVDWTVVVPHQDAAAISGAQDLSVTLKQNTSDKYADTIGDAKSYIVTMGDTTLKSTVLIPLGNDTARRTATLYLVDGNELKKLASVVVDDDGKAAFPLAGTEAGDYVVALDVQDIPQEEVRIPNKLAAEYGIEYTYGATLTDAYGNQYVLTGRVNKLGFGIGELTLIIVGVLVASIVVVGAVMFMWNKQQKRIYANAVSKK